MCWNKVRSKYTMYTVIVKDSIYNWYNLLFVSKTREYYTMTNSQFTTQYCHKEKVNKRKILEIHTQLNL